MGATYLGKASNDQSIATTDGLRDARKRVFTGPDPAQQFLYNLHGYGNGDPINTIDPDGRVAFLIPVLIWAVKAAATYVAISEGIDMVHAGLCDTHEYNPTFERMGNNALVGVAGGAFGRGIQGGMALFMWGGTGAKVASAFTGYGTSSVGEGAIDAGIHGRDYTLGDGVTDFLVGGGTGSLADGVVRGWQKLRGQGQGVTDSIQGDGRIPGAEYGEDRLRKLERYLEKRGVSVEYDTKLLDKGGANGAFVANKDGTGVLHLRNNPTQYEVWHELSHHRHFEALKQNNTVEEAYKAYTASGRRAREQFVYDMLYGRGRTSGRIRWNMLNSAQQGHADDYITDPDVGGRLRRRWE